MGEHFFYNKIEDYAYKNRDNAKIYATQNMFSFFFSLKKKTEVYLL